jgi:hypothetical protein
MDNESLDIRVTSFHPLWSTLFACVFDRAIMYPLFCRDSFQGIDMSYYSSLKLAKCIIHTSRIFYALSFAKMAINIHNYSRKKS